MKKFITLSSAVVLVISLAAYCNSESTDDKDSSVRSRISDDAVVGIVDELTKIIQKLKLEQFVGETILKQYLYKRNDETVYKLAAAAKMSQNIYERRSNDFEKDAIVLLPSQDKISSRKTKRTYIGLRATGPGADEYFVFYIYLRNPSKNEEGTISIGSERKVIEYDGWINPEDESSNGYLWKDCSSSIFIPCRTNQVSSFIKPRKVSKPKFKSSKSSVVSKSILTEDGFDADENLDFYLDLIEGGNQQGRFIFTGLLLGGLGTAIGGPLIALATPILTSIATKVIGEVAGGVAKVAGAGIAGAAIGAFKSATVEVMKGISAMNNMSADGNGTGGGTPAEQLTKIGAGLASSVGSVIKGAAMGGFNGVDSEITKGVKFLLKGRRKRGLEDRDNTRDNEPTTIIVYTYPGWKTLDSLPESPNDTLSHENDVFVGFGACKYKQVTEANYDAAKTSDDVIYLIASALRTQCMEREMEFYVTLFNEGLLTLNPHKTIDISIDSEVRITDKLIPKQRIELSRAFQISIFSQTFKEELYSDKPRILLTNSGISRHVRLLGQTVLNGIEIIRSSFIHHRIKLLRSLAITVKIVIIKLLEDHEAIEDCEACQLDKQVNHSDQMQLMTLLQFIIHGLAPLDKNSKSVIEAFTIFNQTNHLAIQERIKSK